MSGSNSGHHEQDDPQVPELTHSVLPVIEKVFEDRPAEKVVRITFSNPSRLNALNMAAWASLAAILERLADTASKVPFCLLLRGEGASFCSGGDITEYEDLAATPADAATYLDLYMRIFRMLRTLPVPTLAAVDGPAVGAGLALAAACDFRIATPRARFGITAMKMGLIYPIEEIARLASLIGMAATRNVILRGLMLDAEAARKLGLTDEVVADGALEENALALASVLGDTSGPVYAATKKLFARIERGAASETWETREIALTAYASGSFRAASRTFLESQHR